MSELPPNHESYAAVHQPANHHELVYVKQALEALGVPYYVKNELATLGSYSAIGADQMTVMVPGDRAAECRAAIEARLSKPD